MVVHYLRTEPGSRPPSLAASAMSLPLAGIEFDNTFYDAESGVHYLHVGDPASAVDWADTEEGK